MAEYDEKIPEDTTDYLADAPPAVERERKHEAWRKEQDRVLAQVEGEVTLNADEYAPAVAEHNAEQEALALKSFAIESLVATGQYDSFDDMLNKAKALYSWLSEGPASEAQDGPQDGPEEPA